MEQQPEKLAWKDVTVGGLSASQFGSALGFNGRVRDYVIYIREYSKTHGFTGNAATEHGCRVESKSRACYEMIAGHRVANGRFFTTEDRVLACSPDGIVDIPEREMRAIREERRRRKMPAGSKEIADKGGDVARGKGKDHDTLGFGGGRMQRPPPHFSSSDHRSGAGPRRPPPFRLLEIKSPFYSLYDGSKKLYQPHGIPLHYMCQMQGQMAIAEEGYRRTCRERRKRMKERRLRQAENDNADAAGDEVEEKEDGSEDDVDDDDDEEYLGCEECDFFVFRDAKTDDEAREECQVQCFRVKRSQAFWEWCEPKLRLVSKWIREGLPEGIDQTFRFERFDFNKIEVSAIAAPFSISKQTHLYDLKRFGFFFRYYDGQTNANGDGKHDTAAVKEKQTGSQRGSVTGSKVNSVNQRIALKSLSSGANANAIETAAMTMVNNRKRGRLSMLSPQPPLSSSSLLPSVSPSSPPSPAVMSIYDCASQQCDAGVVTEEMVGKKVLGGGGRGRGGGGGGDSSSPFAPLLASAPCSLLLRYPQTAGGGAHSTAVPSPSLAPPYPSPPPHGHKPWPFNVPLLWPASRLLFRFHAYYAPANASIAPLTATTAAAAAAAAGALNSAAEDIGLGLHIDLDLDMLGVELASIIARLKKKKEEEEEEVVMMIADDSIDDDHDEEDSLFAALEYKLRRLKEYEGGGWKSKGNAISTSLTNSNTTAQWHAGDLVDTVNNDDAIILNCHPAASAALERQQHPHQSSFRCRRAAVITELDWEGSVAMVKVFTLKREEGCAERRVAKTNRGDNGGQHSSTKQQQQEENQQPSITITSPALANACAKEVAAEANASSPTSFSLHSYHSFSLIDEDNGCGDVSDTIVEAAAATGTIENNEHIVAARVAKGETNEDDLTFVNSAITFEVAFHHQFFWRCVDFPSASSIPPRTRAGGCGVRSPWNPFVSAAVMMAASAPTPPPPLPSNPPPLPSPATHQNKTAAEASGATAVEVIDADDEERRRMPTTTTSPPNKVAMIEVPHQPSPPASLSAAVTALPTFPSNGISNGSSSNNNAPLFWGMLASRRVPVRTFSTTGEGTASGVNDNNATSVVGAGETNPTVLIAVSTAPPPTSMAFAPPPPLAPPTGRVVSNVRATFGNTAITPGEAPPPCGSSYSPPSAQSHSLHLFLRKAFERAKTKVIINASSSSSSSPSSPLPPPNPISGGLQGLVDLFIAGAHDDVDAVNNTVAVGGDDAGGDVTLPPAAALSLTFLVNLTAMKEDVQQPFNRRVYFGVDKLNWRNNESVKGEEKRGVSVPHTVRCGDIICLPLRLLFALHASTVAGTTREKAISLESDDDDDDEEKENTNCAPVAQSSSHCHSRSIAAAAEGQGEGVSSPLTTGLGVLPPPPPSLRATLSRVPSLVFRFAKGSFCEEEDGGGEGCNQPSLRRDLSSSSASSLPPPPLSPLPLTSPLPSFAFPSSYGGALKRDLEMNKSTATTTTTFDNADAQRVRAHFLSLLSNHQRRSQMHIITSSSSPPQQQPHHQHQQHLQRSHSGLLLSGSTSMLMPVAVAPSPLIPSGPGSPTVLSRHASGVNDVKNNNYAGDGVNSAVEAQKRKRFNILPSSSSSPPNNGGGGGGGGGASKDHPLKREESSGGNLNDGVLPRNSSSSVVMAHSPPLFCGQTDQNQPLLIVGVGGEEELLSLAAKGATTSSSSPPSSPSASPLLFPFLNGCAFLNMPWDSFESHMLGVLLSTQK